MPKRPFVPAQGVSNIELFYDLIFVYCISVLTSLCHHVHGAFLDFHTWALYIFSFLVVLQVWFFTVFLINRYGDRSASDNICLFINMFLLYFLANGVQGNWDDSRFAFNISWALIMANLAVHWLIKRFQYTNLSRDDELIMGRTAIVLIIQVVIVLIAAFLPGTQSEIVSVVALAFGAAVFLQSKLYRRTPSRFGHLVERCSLLVIVAFGETIVAIATYMVDVQTILYPVLVFALVVGLFLIFIYEHDNMTDHQKETDGMAYLTLTGVLILIIGNLSVALEYMPEDTIAFVPKSVYLTACLVLYLLGSFLFGRYNKVEFTMSGAYALGRIGACVFIIVVSAVSQCNPAVCLLCSTVAVYFALWHEWMLFHGRMKLMAFGHSLGSTEARTDGASEKGKKDAAGDEPEKGSSGSPEEG